MRKKSLYSSVLCLIPLGGYLQENFDTHEFHGQKCLLEHLDPRP
jgi:hypothetical protein